VDESARDRPGNRQSGNSSSGGTLLGILQILHVDFEPRDRSRHVPADQHARNKSRAGSRSCRSSGFPLSRTSLTRSKLPKRNSRIFLAKSPGSPGSQSAPRVSVEELECLATWKEGSSRYLVGRLHHGHASSNEDRYRCFVYEKAGQTVQTNLNRAAMGIGALEHEVALPAGPLPEGSAEVYRVAQSGDATCNGLFSPMEGSRTMTLRKGESLTHLPLSLAFALPIRARPACRDLTRIINAALGRVGLIILSVYGSPFVRRTALCYLSRCGISYFL